MELFGKRHVTAPKGSIGIVVDGPTNGRRYKENNNTVTEFLMAKLFGDTPTSGTVEDLITDIAIGTGTTSIEYTDTALGNVSASGSIDESPSISTMDIGGTNHTVITVTKSFLPGSLVGSLSEVGLFSGSDMLAGSLIKDELGNPSPITVGSDDQIIVTYSLAFDLSEYPVELDSGTINVNGSVYNFTINHMEALEVASGNLYVKNPSRGATPTSGDKTIYVNGTQSTTSNSTVVRSQTYDAAERSTEWLYEATVFATFSNGDISSLGLLPVSRGTPATMTGPAVQLSFTPAIARPVDNKIVIRYRFKIYW